MPTALLRVQSKITSDITFIIGPTCHIASYSDVYSEIYTLNYTKNHFSVEFNKIKLTIANVINNFKWNMIIFEPYNAGIFVYNTMETKGFFQFKIIIINVLVSSFCLNIYVMGLRSL